jgi:hypothetical protein
MRLSNILVSFAATAMAAWIFMFASEVHAHPVVAPTATIGHVNLGVDHQP